MKELDIDILDKTEIWIEPVRLEAVDLQLTAAAVANALKLEPREVFVVEAGERKMALDILRRRLDMAQIAGREVILLRNLSQVKGITIYPETRVHSEGILAMIALDSAEAEKVLHDARELSHVVDLAVNRRVAVLPTGGEIIDGLIRDTNSPCIKSILERRGFIVNIQNPVRDDIDLIAGRLRRLTEEGYSFVLTTGGVGAEGKDCTVEAVIKLDKDAVTPYIMTFKPGGARHLKYGVRIAVGEYQGMQIISLPGPNHEVRQAMTVVEEEIGRADAARMGGLIVSTLRQLYI